MNFTFNPTTYETCKPNIYYIENFCQKHGVKNPSLDLCFQTAMTLISGPVETVRELANYLYYHLNH